MPVVATVTDRNQNHRLGGFDWQPRWTRDEWVDQVPTLAGHSQRPPPTP
jgi:hypothetical protein